MKSVNINYLPAIDHLRAFAAILILIYHGQSLIYNKVINSDNVFDHWIEANNPLSAMIIEGHTAVALFMVLSGFIFTYGSYNKEISYLTFIYNRFLRVYPLYIFIMFVGIYTFPENYSLSGMLQSLFLFSNLPGSLNIGPFSAMFWTISVEFSFYLMFPFLLKFLHQGGMKKMATLILVMIIFRMFSFLLGTNIRDISYWTIIGRMDQLIVGMIIAKLYIQISLNRTKWIVILIISTILILLSLFMFNKLGGWPSIEFWKLFWPSIEGGMWGLFVLSYIKLVVGNKNIIQTIISKIGEVSFSIYLTHYIVASIIVQKEWFLSFPFNIFKNAVINSVLVILPITLVVSIFTFNTIEQPFLGLRRKYLDTNK